MRYRSLFCGLFLIIFGTLWLLRSLEVVSFGWCDFCHLWPFLLLFIGVACLPIKQGLKFIINVVLLLVASFTLIYNGQKHTTFMEQHIYMEYSGDDVDEVYEDQDEDTFTL